MAEERNPPLIRREGGPKPPSEEPARVTNEPPPEHAGGAEPPAHLEDDEYKWHTGERRPTGADAAVEFVDVHKAFGRNKILRGLNLEIPEDKISMILGPSGTGK